MSLLYKHLRVHQIFGANTDVGKTVIASALTRASASRDHTVFYLKPVSTGPLQDADDEYVKRYAGQWKNRIHTECLFRLTEPVSPHLAAALAIETGAVNETYVPSDETLANAIASNIRRSASLSTRAAHMYVETAGGVHSPTITGTTQLDSYRPLFLPTILIGDSRLGGISSTISSYESLLLRGYIVDSILLFRDEYYRNWEYLQSYFQEKGVNVASFPAPPDKIADEHVNFLATEKYYDDIASGDDMGVVNNHLDSCHENRLQELDSMAGRTLSSIWWPFVQHGLVEGEKDVTTIDSAWSDFFSVYNPHRSHSKTPDKSLLNPQLDGSASWWTQALGHAHPSLTLAAARAAGRYGHVMFPQATHLPALKLAERLIQDGPGKGWASRAFFSDDGSTGMEVALKMALRAYSRRAGITVESAEGKGLGVIGLKGSYHGDTIGVMDACEEGVYTCEWHNAKGYWFEPPTISMQKGSVYVTVPSAITSTTAESSTIGNDLKALSSAYDVTQRLNTPLAKLYRDYIEQTLNRLHSKETKLAALVLEPLVMGAGGMIFVDPLFQRVLIDVVRGSDKTSVEWSGLPVIFDEVFVGLYRLGLQSASPLLGVTPDISVNAKILTGGLVPLAITLASDSIFQAFLSQNKTDSLLHGHSYTAHPIGCEVANETLNIVEALAASDSWDVARAKWVSHTPDKYQGIKVWSFWDPDFVRAISHMEVVSEVMTLGTVLAIKTTDDTGGYSSQTAQILLKSIANVGEEQTMSPAPGGAPFGVHYRTLGNVAYFMTSLNTSAETIRSVEDKIWRALHRAHIQGTP